MKRSAKTALILLAWGALLFHAHGVNAQKVRAANAASVITSVRVEPSYYQYGPLYATIGGRERKIADEAAMAWIIHGGLQVVYSGRDGTGGFENEGQSLRIYDVRTGKRRKILAEYVMIDKVVEVITSSHKSALIVEMSDGGIGASYLAIVDPTRGEVFSRNLAKVLSRRGDTILIGHYKIDEWYKLEDNPKAKLIPYKMERQNLNTILRRRVIVNKPDI